MSQLNRLCPDCDDPSRREFLRVVGSGAAAAAIAGAAPGLLLAEEKKDAKTPETLVKQLYDSLNDRQRGAICFDWDYQDPKRGLLRTRVANNWNVTEQMVVDSDFYSDDQQAIIRKIFEGIINPEWHKRIDKQLEDDAGGYGVQNSIALFGKPGTEKFEFVMTGRHMTIRCDGNSADHVAFGGPIFYGHAADGFDEGPTHPGNVFWPQAEAANKLYTMLDGKQQKLALVPKGVPKEQKVGFQGKQGHFQGLPVSELSGDQKEHLQKVMALLVEPY